MASTKAKDLREMSSEELTKRFQELKADGVTPRVQATTGQLEDTAKIRTVRREVAQLLTVLNERRNQA